MRRSYLRRGILMATILALQPRLEKLVTKLHYGREHGAARVIIFPGVRYERMPEASAAIVRSGKKSRKTA
jgi:hypothetical protein